MSFSVLGLTVYPYGLCCGLGMLAMLLWLLKTGKKPGDAGRFAVLLLVCGIVGARILYCAVHVSDYLEDFGNGWLMLRFFDGGFSMIGLLLGLLLACLWQSRLSGTSFGKTLDRIVGALPLLVAALRGGECFTELGVGKIVHPGGITESLPWLFVQSRMGKAVEYRMNVRLYEIIAAGIIFVVMLCFSKRLAAYDGCLGALFFVLYGGTQILLESLRDDGHMLVIFLRIGQLGAAIMLLCAFAAMRRRARRLGSLGIGESIVRWTVLLLGIGLAVLVEFSLDGRLVLGTPTVLRDYLVLGAVCIALMTVALRTLADACRLSAKEEAANESAD